MLRKDHCLPFDAKFVSVSSKVNDKQPELDTRCKRRHPACEHDTSFLVLTQLNYFFLSDLFAFI